jgi:hypothetical protein
MADLEGRDILLMRVGKHNGVDYTDEAFDGIKANTMARGQDIIFAPVEKKNLPAHSLERRGHGIVPLQSAYETMGK